MSARTCSNCGAPMSAFARFCGSCGRPVDDGVPGEDVARVSLDAPGETPASAPTSYGNAPTFEPSRSAHPSQPAWSAPVAAGPLPPRTSGAASASFVLGLVTWVLTFVVIGIFTGLLTAPVAIGLGVAGRRAAEERPEEYRGSGLAAAGLTLGLSWMIVATALVSWMVWARAGWL